MQLEDDFLRLSRDVLKRPGLYGIYDIKQLYIFYLGCRVGRIAYSLKEEGKFQFSPIERAFFFDFTDWIVAKLNLGKFSKRWDLALVSPDEVKKFEEVKESDQHAFEIFSQYFEEFVALKQAQFAAESESSSQEDAVDS
jgi:hypothetical protein